MNSLIATSAQPLNLFSDGCSDGWQFHYKQNPMQITYLTILLRASRGRTRARRKDIVRVLCDRHAKSLAGAELSNIAFHWWIDVQDTARRIMFVA